MKVGILKCEKCNHIWNAMYEKDEKNECPNCARMAGCRYDIDIGPLYERLKPYTYQEQQVLMILAEEVQKIIDQYTNQFYQPGKEYTIIVAGKKRRARFLRIDHYPVGFIAIFDDGHYLIKVPLHPVIK